MFLKLYTTNIITFIIGYKILNVKNIYIRVIIQ